MKAVLGFALLSALLCGAANAQTPTVVTGTISDPNGVPYSFAKISAQLIPTTASPTVLVNGNPTQIGGQQNATTDANGSFSMNLFCNSAGGGCSVISPASTQWQFTVQANGAPPPLGTGPQSCVALVTVTGASQSISASFSCPALSRSGSGTGLPKNVVDITSSTYAGGAQFDGRISFSCTLTNTSNLITCPDGNFTGTDVQGRAVAKVGQALACTTATTDLSMETSVPVTWGGNQKTTISTIDSATQIHVVGNSNTSSVAASFCAFGDIDGPDQAVTPTTANDPYLASWTVATNQSNCVPLGLPAGISIVDHWPAWRTYPASGGCGNQNEITNTRRGINIFGQGSNETIIIVLPDAPATDCNGPNATGSSCIALLNPTVHNLQITGMGNSAPGAAYNGKNLFLVAGLFPGVNYELENVFLFGFGANQSTGAAGPTGLNIGGGISNGQAGGTMKNVNVETFGARGCLFDANPNGGGVSVNFVDALWCNASQINLKIQSSTWVHSVNGLFGWQFGVYNLANQIGVSVVVDGGGRLESVNDICTGGTATGGSPCYVVNNAASVINIVNAIILNTAAGASAFQPQLGLLGVSGSYVQAAFPFFFQTGAVTFQDRGGNQYVPGTTFVTLAAGTVWVPYKSVAGICTGTVGAAATDGFYGTGPNVTATACAATLGNGVVMDHSGTVRLLIATASAGGVNASDGVVTVLKNGATQTVTATLGTGTSASDGAHSFSYVTGDRISCQIVTQAASTAANPTCMIDLGSL